MVSSCNEWLTSFSKYSFIGLSAVSCLFLMIGAISYSHKKDTMKNIPWFYVTYPNVNDDKIYYTLKGQYIEELNNAGDFSTRDDIERYKQCNNYGYSAYVLVVIACLSSLCCAFLSSALIKNDFTFGQFIGCALAGLATLMSGIALALFMGGCQNALKEFTDDFPGYEYHWGAASILVAVSMVMMFIVSLSMFLTAKFCSGPAAGSEGGSCCSSLCNRNKNTHEPVDSMTTV